MSAADVVPGEITGPGGAIALNEGAVTIEILVVNTGDRPVQVGSHYHFAEANPALRFDRVIAWGHRLDVAAGTSVRFEPGIELTVALIPIGGDRIVLGLRGLVGGALDG